SVGRARELAPLDHRTGPAVHRAELLVAVHDGARVVGGLVRTEEVAVARWVRWDPVAPSARSGRRLGSHHSADLHGSVWAGDGHRLPPGPLAAPPHEARPADGGGRSPDPRAGSALELSVHGPSVPNAV